MRFIPLALAPILIAPLAFADAPPEPPRKDVPYAVVVDNIGAISGFAIVLYPWHERPGAPWSLGVFAPGVELSVDSDAKEPRIYRVKSEELGSLRVEVQNAKSLEKARLAIALKGTECGYSLPKHEQVLAKTSTTFVRKHVRIDTHLLCEMQSGQNEYLGPDPDAAAVASAAQPAASTPSWAAPSASAGPAPAAPLRKGCGSCGVGRPLPSSASAWAIVALLGWVLRRRRA